MGFLMVIDWNTYVYRCPTGRCASHKTRQKYCNIEQDEKRACIPRLIWNDGHSEWSRWYWFVKDDVCRVACPYCGFKW